MPDRKRKLNVDPEEVVSSVITRLDSDIEGRQQWMDMRLARYAKYRGWLPNKTYPWDNCANVHIPVMWMHSQQIQDTLLNAVMTIRPPIRAVATKRQFSKREEAATQVIDHQVFVDQPGEERIGELIEKFTNDGLLIAYITWVRDTRDVTDFRFLPPLAPTLDRKSQLGVFVSETLFKDAEVISSDESGDKWKILLPSQNGKARKATVIFDEDETGNLEAEITKPMAVYDGPVLIVKNVEDVVWPWRSGNLQPPSPENPHGAPHVFLLDYPLYDEIARLQKQGFYDLLTSEDLETVKASEGKALEGQQTEEPKKQKDAIEGVEAQTPGTTKKPLTRILAFDQWDVNGDGLNEHVMFWILKEPRLLLRARLLGEMYPIFPPTRPLVAKPFIPVGPDRLYGISTLEISEPLHDIIVTAINQAVDNGTLTNTPFGFYEPGSGLKGEIMRLWPGEMYPLRDPQRTVYFPQLPNSSQAFFFNLITISQQYLERAMMQGELSFGRVPKGGSSMLRNQGSFMALLRQGEARPERILRRLFLALSEIWSIFHSLDQRFLTAEKEILIAGVKSEEERYRKITDAEEIRGDFSFTFQASLLNTSPEVIQQSLLSLGGAIFSPLAFQLGTADAERYYNWETDLVKAAKLDPERYVLRPTPEAGRQRLLAEEVIFSIMEGELPDALPLEDPMAHLTKLIEFTRDDRIGLLGERELGLFKAHLQRVKLLVAQQERAKQIAAAAAQLQGALGGGGRGEVGMVPSMAAPMISGGGELIDETLPGAGGGANESA